MVISSPDEEVDFECGGPDGDSPTRYREERNRRTSVDDIVVRKTKLMKVDRSQEQSRSAPTSRLPDKPRPAFKKLPQGGQTLLLRINNRPVWKSPTIEERCRAICRAPRTKTQLEIPSFLLQCLDPMNVPMQNLAFGSLFPPHLNRCFKRSESAPWDRENGLAMEAPITYYNNQLEILRFLYADVIGDHNQGPILHKLEQVMWQVEKCIQRVRGGQRLSNQARMAQHNGATKRYEY